MNTAFKIVAIALLSTAFMGLSFAQETATRAVTADAEKSGAVTTPSKSVDVVDIAKKLANPIANMISVPFQYEFSRGLGKNQGGSGGFTLTQDALTDILEIRNPVGGSIAKITIKPGEAILERDGQLTTAIDADTFIQDALGLPLPARGLSDWLRGQTRSGSNASVERNTKGQVTKITQDGWTLNYNWGNSQHLERLTMTRSSNIGSIDIRLVFDTPNE